MTETTFTAFFGDRERTFVITPALIPELERTTGAGIGTLAGRLAKREFRFADIIETTRIGLIGGGASPKDAADLVETYVKARPLEEGLLIATGVLSALWFGTPKAAPSPAPEGDAAP